MAKFSMYKDKDNRRKWMFSGYIATCPLTGKKQLQQEKDLTLRQKQVRN